MWPWASYLTSFGLSCPISEVWKCHNTTNLREFLWELNEHLIYVLIYMQCLTHNGYSINRKCCNFIGNTVGKTLANGLGREKARGIFSGLCIHREEKTLEKRSVKVVLRPKCMGMVFYHFGSINQVAFSFLLWKNGWALWGQKFLSVR